MANNFRIEELNKFKKTLEQEIEKRKTLSHKYQRYEKNLCAINYAMLAADFAMGTTGVAMVSSGILVLPGMVLSGLVAGLSVFNIILSAVAKQLGEKAEKHRRIEDLASSKLNLICSLFSKALDDNFVTDEEFSNILSVLEKYSKAKQQIGSQYASPGAMEKLTTELQQKKQHVLNDGFFAVGA